MPIASFSIQNRAPAVRIRMNACIYCANPRYREKDERRLGDEHVIPESLGGNLILDNGSCESCERRVNAFEQSILKSVLYAPRVHLGVRRKSRKRGEETVTVDAKVDDKDVKITLPIKRVPVTLFLPILDSPGLLLGRPPHFNAMRGMWLIHLSNEPPVSTGLQSLASPVLDTFKFTQFLAKIAHCYAVSVLESSFTPMLTSTILNDPALNFDLVGGASSQEEAPSANLHEMEIDWQRSAGTDYAIVKIRMFSNLGAPTYRVIAGKR